MTNNLHNARARAPIYRKMSVKIEEESVNDIWRCPVWFRYNNHNIATHVYQQTNLLPVVANAKTSLQGACCLEERKEPWLRTRNKRESKRGKLRLGTLWRDVSMEVLGGWADYWLLEGGSSSTLIRAARVPQGCVVPTTLDIGTSVLYPVVMKTSRLGEINIRWIKRRRYGASGLMSKWRIDVKIKVLGRKDFLTSSPRLWCRPQDQ